MNKIFIFEFWNASPHLETSFELAKRHLDKGDQVTFFFLGHDVEFKQGLSFAKEEMIHPWFLPERKFARLLKNKKFEFKTDVKFDQPSISFPRVFTNLEEIKKITYKKAEIGLAAVSTIVSKYRSTYIDVAEKKEEIKKLLLSGAMVYDYTVDILKHGTPDFVYFFNGRFVNYRSVKNACESQNIPYRIHERGANKTKYSFQNFMPHDFSKRRAEINATWEKARAKPKSIQIGKRFFIDRRQGKEQSWHSFAKMQKKGYVPTIESQKKIISFFSSSEDEYFGVGDIVKWDRWPNQMAALKSVINCICDDQDIHLIIRLHPNVADMNKIDQGLWLNLNLPQNASIIEPTSKVDSYGVMEASDLIITAGSTMGIEAVYWGKPSICLGPSLYEDLDAVFLPKNEEELKKLIYTENLEVDPQTALAYGYYFSTFGEDFRYYEPKTLFRGLFLGTDQIKYSKYFNKRVYKDFVHNFKKR